MQIHKKDINTNRICGKAHKRQTTDAKHIKTNFYIIITCTRMEFMDKELEYRRP